jgi:hypothetical protein
MIGTVGALLLGPERTGPVVTDGTGLAVSLVTLAVLAAYQVAAPWYLSQAPGPLRQRPPEVVREFQQLYWAAATVLVLLVGFVVIERFVVLSS